MEIIMTMYQHFWVWILGGSFGSVKIQWVSEYLGENIQCINTVSFFFIFGGNNDNVYTQSVSEYLGLIITIYIYT